MVKIQHKLSFYTTDQRTAQLECLRVGQICTNRTVPPTIRKKMGEGSNQKIITISCPLEFNGETWAEATMKKMELLGYKTFHWIVVTHDHAFMLST